MSRTLSGLFLVGALNRPRKRKRTNRENPRTIPEQIGKIPGKVPKGQKRTKKEGQVQIGKPPRLKHPLLAALDGGISRISNISKFSKISRRWILLYKDPPKIPKCQNNTAFTRTFSRSSRELLPSCLLHESGTQGNFFRKTCSDDLLVFCVDCCGWIFLLS